MKNIGIVLLILIAVIVGFLLTGENEADFITGGGTFSCHRGYEGIECDNIVYKNAEEDCGEEEVKVCTNYCILEKVLMDKDLTCPDYCEAYCVPKELAWELNR
jgi:hypothetical protein